MDWYTQRDMTTRKYVGKTIKLNRIRLGLKQAELAKKMKISQPKLSKIENGKLCPNALEADRYLKLTGEKPIWAK